MTKRHFIKNLDIAIQYAKRYGVDGSYHGRFRSQDPTSLQEKQLILRVIRKTIEDLPIQENGNFDLFDFGGGGGRFFQVFLDVLKALPEPDELQEFFTSGQFDEAQKYLYESKQYDELQWIYELRQDYEMSQLFKNRKLKVITYDIVGLDDSYKNRLTRSRFEIDDTATQSEVGDLVRRVATCSSQEYSNITFDFFSGPVMGHDFLKIREWYIEMREKIGDVDGSVTLFGSLAHVFGEARREAARWMNDSTRGYFGATLPSINVHKADIAKFRGSPGLEEGDAYYKAENGEEFPYHHYTKARLEGEIEGAGFQDVKISPAAFFHPLTIAKNGSLGVVDGMIRGTIDNIPEPIKPSTDSVSSYFEVFAASSRCHELVKRQKDKPNPSLEGARKPQQLSSNETGVFIK